MKIIRTLPVIAFVALTGCAQLSAEDKALLNDTRNMAMEAKNQSAMAAQAAQQAQQSAAQSAAAAQASAEKADRIFRQSQKK
ncbi:MAG: hypothetical protein PHY92_06880 [Alphaproteobacteria bacterium]|nr:hypothetical protein [Alphaproteobacteria bacterium]